MLKKQNNYSEHYKYIAIFCIIILTSGLTIFIISGHSSPVISEYSSPVEIQTIKPAAFEYSDPLYFDLEKILKRGTIRLITQYTYSSYFLHQGINRGFEYEFVSHFAKEHGLKVEVVLTDYSDEAIELLNRGEGDLIAKNVAITSYIGQYVAFSQPYDMMNIQSENQYIYNINSVEHDASNQSGIVSLERESIIWAMRENAPVLKQKADEFIQKHFQVRESDGRIVRSAYLNLLRRQYFEGDSWTSSFPNPSYHSVLTGYLSPYDELVKKIAKEAEVDWKLVVAIMAQESAFNPNAESKAGAIGLMQIIPRFSLVENVEQLYDPETNIREGVRYIRKHINNHAHLDSLNRYSMALATYNVGSGNLSDAKQLTEQLGNNPYEWTHVAESLLKLMHPEYYEDARFGYKRGTETVDYVNDVLNRYNNYHTVYRWAGTFEGKVLKDF